MRRSAWQLYQKASSLSERVKALAVEADDVVPPAGALLAEADAVLERAMEALKVEMERRRALRAQYERDLKKVD